MKIKVTKRATFIGGGSTTPNPLDLIALGFRGNEYRQDLSDYVIHFTKGEDDDAAYWNMQKILYEGCIKRGPTAFGISRDIPELDEKNRAVCFSETPLGYLSHLVERRSLYGIGFRKDLIAARGGNQIWYTDSNSQCAGALRKLKTIAKPRQEHDRRFRGVDITNPIWDVCPFVEYTFGFGDLQHRFEWEREWRVLNDFDFTPSEVEFLLIPQELHAQARRFFEDVERDNTGPAYLCPYIDPRWNLNRFLPLNERLEQRLGDAVETLEVYLKWLKLTGADAQAVESLISTIQAFPFPTEPIPEASGEGRVEKVLWDETRELTPEEIQELFSKDEDSDSAEHSSMVRPYGSMVEQSTVITHEEDSDSEDDTV